LLRESFVFTISLHKFLIWPLKLLFFLISLQCKHYLCIIYKFCIVVFMYFLYCIIIYYILLYIIYYIFFYILLCIIFFQIIIKIYYYILLYFISYILLNIYPPVCKYNMQKLNKCKCKQFYNSTIKFFKKSTSNIVAQYIGVVISFHLRSIIAFFLSKNYWVQRNWKEIIQHIPIAWCQNYFKFILNFGNYLKKYRVICKQIIYNNKI